MDYWCRVCFIHWQIEFGGRITGLPAEIIVDDLNSQAELPRQLAQSILSFNQVESKLNRQPYHLRISLDLSSWTAHGCSRMKDESLRFCSEAIQVSKRKPKPYHRSRDFIAIDLTGNFSIITIRLESSSTVALSGNKRLPFCRVLAKQFKFSSVSPENPPFLE